MAVSMKGRVVDMNAMVQKNHHVRAIGNASMNAGGDRIGPRGEVLKTRSQIDAEIVAYFRENPHAVRQASISALEGEIFSPSDAWSNAKAQRAATPVVADVVDPIPAPVPTTSRRKISDSE